MRPIKKMVKQVSKTYGANKGGSSEIQFYLLLPEGVSAVEHARDIARSHKKIESAISLMISGNFSFSEQLDIFYTPSFIEIGHELIHALHSSEGKNAGQIKIRQEDIEVWSHMEEFITITVNPLCENRFASEFGMVERYSHEALPYITLRRGGMKVVRAKQKELKEKVKFQKKRRKKLPTVDSRSKKG